MPGDYRNSLGFLNLQLRAGQLAQDQARQFQLEQQGREAQQQDIANTLSFMQHHEAAKSASEDRKLQLAAMLQKATEANQTRKDIQELKDKAAAPERDSKVKKNAAQAHLADVQAEDIPKDTTEVNRSHLANEANVRRGQDLGLYGRVAAAGMNPGPFGTPQLQISPDFVEGMQGALNSGPATTDTSTPTEQVPTPQVSAPPSPASNEPTPPASSVAQPPPQQHTISTLLKVAPPPDPNVQRLTPKDLVKHAESANQAQNSAADLGTLYNYADKELKDEDFGALGGLGPANAIKDIAGSVGKILPGEPGADLRAGTERRGFFTQGIGLQLAQIIHDFSGAQSSDQEAQRLGSGLGLGAAKWHTIINQGINAFVNDKPTFMKVLKAAIDWKQRTANRETQIVQDKGIRVAPPAASSGANDILKHAMNDPVVSQKLKDAESRLPAGLTPEQKEAALAALARRLLPQQASP